MSAGTALRDHLDRTDTVFVLTRRADGEERSTPIWAVVADGEPYIRSVNGADGLWFRRAMARGAVAFEVEGTRIDADVERVEDAATIAAVDAALEAKYARQRGSVQSMLTDSARECTLRVVARQV
ncbi:MAG TPA: DUF2255 family protein [Pseudolysinimonas sp.]|jgi:hypothetical protein|nr:DUF2255 family protein [Pseudolysinimonas sp.]